MISKENILRVAERRDAPAIADIYNESIRARDATMEMTEKKTSDIETMIEGLTERERLLVIENGDGVQGWGVLKRYSDREGYRFACETSVYLRRAIAGQRTGIGTALQTALMDLARQLEYHHIVVKIWATNVISIRMHEKFGFEMVGVQREIGYSDGQWQDVVIMQCLC